MNKKQIISIVAFALLLVLILLRVILGIALNNQHKREIKASDTNDKAINLIAQDTVNVSKIENYITKTSKEEDETIYLIKDKAQLKLNNASLTKESGDSTDLSKSENIGLNSVIVVSYTSNLKLDNTTINLKAKGSNGIYLIGENTRADVNNTTISSINTNSSGIVANETATFNGNRLTITTKVKESPAIKTLNHGTIKLEDSMLETNGSASPVIYAEGNASITNTTATAFGSRASIQNGESNVEFVKSTINVSAGSGEEGIKESAFLLYNNNKKGKSVLTLTDSSININKELPYYNKASLFLFNNSNSIVNIENSITNFGSNNLFDITKSTVVINAKNQNLSGNILIDDQSTLQLNLENKTSYTGSIPKTKSNTSIKLSKDSKLVLSGDIYLTSLENEDSSNNNIITNNHHIYVNNNQLK